MKHTPAAEWRDKGEPDPHEGHYDCERHQLSCGQLSDDRLANAAFLGYDQPLNLEKVIAGDKDYFSPIALMTAVKDRIRWLSRRTVKLESQRDELIAALKEIVEEGEFYQSHIDIPADSGRRFFKRFQDLISKHESN